MLKRIIQSSLAFTMATLLSGFALPASAATHGVDLTVRNAAAQSMCLDASLDKGREGRVVYAYQCTGRYNQRWTLTDGEDGSSALVGLGGECLDIRGRSVGDNTPVQLWRCHYGPNQQFNVTSTGQLRERQSGKCLTIGRNYSNRTPVYIDECENNPRQRWIVQH